MSNQNYNRPNRIVDINGAQYKLVQIIDKTASDLHHIIWKCNQYKYNVKAKENLIRIPRRKHVALNQFFGDKQNPRDQFKEVYEITKSVLSEWVRRELYTLLYEADDELFYIPEVLKTWKKKKKSGLSKNS